MKTLLIYDNEGYIIQQITGSYRIPVGVPYIEIEQSSYEGKIIKSVDTTGTPHTPVLEDIPKSEIEIANEKIAELENALVELASLVGGAN